MTDETLKSDVSFLLEGFKQIERTKRIASEFQESIKQQKRARKRNKQKMKSESRQSKPVTEHAPNESPNEELEANNH